MHIYIYIYTCARAHTHINGKEQKVQKEPHIWSTDFHKRCKGNSMEKVQSYQQIGLEKMKIHMLKK